MTILHNNRCGKSREVVNYLTQKGFEFSIIDYIKNPLSADELKNLCEKLNLKPIDIVRTNESIWKEQFKNQSLSDENLFNILQENPKLIQRPIVIFEGKAIIARPLDVLLPHL